MEIFDRLTSFFGFSNFLNVLHRCSLADIPQSYLKSMNNRCKSIAIPISMHASDKWLSILLVF